MSMITTIKGMNKKKLLMIIGLAVILVAAVFLVRESGIEFENLTPSKIREYLLSFGMVKGALVYLAIYAFSIRPFVPIPPTLYTFVGGFTFGPIWGTVLTVTGATLNASRCCVFIFWGFNHKRRSYDTNCFFLGRCYLNSCALVYKAEKQTTANAVIILCKTKHKLFFSTFSNSSSCLCFDSLKTS